MCLVLPTSRGVGTHVQKSAEAIACAEQRTVQVQGFVVHPSLALPYYQVDVAAPGR